MTPVIDPSASGVTVDWNTLLIVFITGVGGVVAVSLGGVKRLISFWFEIFEMRLRKRFASGIKQISLMYRLLEDAKRKPYVHRILLLTGRNGGGIPQPPHPFTVSAHFGWSQKDGVDPASFYNFDIRADLPYMQMLQECIKVGFVAVRTEKMPDNSMLKSYYKSEGVVDSLLYYLHIDPNNNELHYCSFANYERNFADSEVHSINLIVDRMRSTLQYRA